MRRSVAGLVALVIALPLALAACGAPKIEPALVLPPTPVLAMSIRWAVVAVDGLRLRDQPDQTGRILLSLTEGSRVEVLARTPDAMEIDGQTDYWYQVNHNGLRGWTFGAFLTEVPGLTEASALTEGSAHAETDSTGTDR